LSAQKGANHEEAWADALAAAQSLKVDLIRIEMQGAEGLDAALESVAFLNTVRTNHFDEVLALRPLLPAVVKAA